MAAFVLIADAVRRRVNGARDEILARHRERTVLVVTHVTPVKLLVAVGLTPFIYLGHAFVERKLGIQPVVLGERKPVPNRIARHGIAVRDRPQDLAGFLARHAYQSNGGEHGDNVADVPAFRAWAAYMGTAMDGRYRTR